VTPRHLPAGPAYRTLKGQRVIAELIVMCDHCGNREIGWAWRDGPGELWYDGEAEPPHDLGPARDDIADTPAGMREAKAAGGRLTGPVTRRRLSIHLDDGHLIAYCPKHGGCITLEPVELPTSGPCRRLRARHPDTR
jgi:hypothetical protein